MLASCDRGLHLELEIIIGRLQWRRCGFISESGGNWTAEDVRRISMRSRLDRHAIVAWLSCDRGSFIAESGATIPPTDGPWSWCDCGHHSHRSTGSNGHDFWAKNPFKTDVFPLFTSTLDWIVKELSNFKERSRVLRDPPTFRLNCKAIREGLITNHHRISLNFPLEFRTSARKKSSKFASIRVNWSSILAEIGLVVRFDRLSGGNLSFN